MFHHSYLKTLISALGFVVLGLATSQAADFSVNPNRFDPYKQFKFRVKWDGRYISGVTKVSGLHRETEVVTNRPGNEPGILRKSPGKTSYTPIHLERGRTHDTAFETWANKVYNPADGKVGWAKDYKVEGDLILFAPDGTKKRRWRLVGLWPKNVRMGEGDMTQSRANRIQVTFRVDKILYDGTVAA